MFKKYLDPYKKDISINLVIKSIGTLMEILLPAILAYIIDTVVPREDKNAIIMGGLLMVVIAIVAWILNIIANRMSAKLSTSIIFQLRQDLFSKSLNLSPRQVDMFGASSLESRLTSDTYTVHRFLAGSLRMGIRVLLVFFGGIFFCFVLSPKLASILIFMIIAILFFVGRIFSKGLPLFRAVQEKLDNMVQIIRENISGIRIIKALNKTDYEKERYSEANHTYKDVEISASYTMAALRPVVNSILFTGLAFVLVYGSVLVKRGEINTGVIMAFMTYFIQITNSFIGLNFIFNIYNRASACWDRIEEVLVTPLDDNQLEKKDTVKLPEASASVPEIEFKNVSFSYLGEKNNLENISFKIYPGQTLGIMGSTGSGKTTIIRLMLRQYDATEGQVIIRGVDIKDLAIEDIKRIFSGAFQSDFLYAGTIRENISFGRDLSQSEIEEAVSYAMANEFVYEKENNLDFELASKGVNLSGGQKQRLILARALAAKPEILILDDSTSALDFKTESKVRKVLKENFENTTSIIIGQRVASVAEADLILILNEGRCIALGSHEELMKESPLYKEIFQMQLGKGRDI